jgi:hypothetical protein
MINLSFLQSVGVLEPLVTSREPRCVLLPELPDLVLGHDNPDRGRGVCEGVRLGGRTIGTD